MKPSDMSLLRCLWHLPILRGLRKRRFNANFEAGHAIGVCRGIYPGYPQAAAAVPPGQPIGYDHEATTTMYRDRMKRIFPADYPMLHWLTQAFRDGATRVFDLGGHVGLSYYAYRHYLDYPSGMQWLVSDVPAINRAGVEVAHALDTHQCLSFTDDFSAASGSDVLFTSGCLQYLEQTLSEKIAGLPAHPRWVLVNLLPLHEQSAYWTVQSIGTAFCPYRIQRRDEFIQGMRDLGYELLDDWVNPEKRCEIAFEPAHSLEGYAGMAFRLPAR